MLQTGSGKTHTMLGDIDELGDRPNDNRGMTPRIFEYLFSRIQQVNNVEIYGTALDYYRVGILVLCNFGQSFLGTHVGSSHMMRDRSIVWIMLCW